MQELYEKILSAHEAAPVVLATMMYRAGFARALAELIPRECHDAAYVRKKLATRDGAELALLRWRRELACAAHDHGEAAGFIALLAGRFVERRWVFAGEELRLVSTTAHTAPTVLSCAPGMIHDLSSPDGGLSLHVYYGHGGSARIFDPERRLTLRVNADALAELPVSPAVILEATAWSEA